MMKFYQVTKIFKGPLHKNQGTIRDIYQGTPKSRYVGYSFDQTKILTGNSFHRIEDKYIIFDPM